MSSPKHHYRVGKNVKNLREIMGTSYLNAAVLTARKLYGAGICAKRIYGSDDFSGYFQAYQVVHTAYGIEKRDVGNPFHLQKLPYVPSENSSKPYRMFDGLRYVKNRDLK